MLTKAALATTAAAFALGASALALQAQAAEESGVKAGILTCNVDSGWGFIFGSSRKIKCVYSHDHG
jgi:hypothetical protein